MASLTANADLTVEHEKNVRPWLDMIDTLRAQGVHQDLPLPQIAVMGDQSSGKSSVLEALSGVPFPRGSGLVTRCPTQLIMKRTPAGTPWKAVATISRLHYSPQALPAPVEVSKPHELTAVILSLTEALTAGSSGGFSQDSIVINVASPDVPDLTLIDLPGIVRTTTSGQDGSVIEAVNELLDAYLESERTIILCVLPANQDVATVDILERAAEVDPSGDRTIGVLTKPDLVSPGGEQVVLDTVSNRVKPLKLGYVLMRNRTQLEMADGVSFEQARALEADYFGKHEHFKTLPPHLLGGSSLTTRLTELLVKRIRTVLPVMKFELMEMQRETNREMKALGREVPRNRGEQINTLMKIIAEYCSLLRSAVSGDYRKDVLAVEPRLRLRTLADNSFRALTETIKRTEPNFDSATFHASLESEIRALKGRELPGLVNSYFFFSFMVSKIEDWHEPVDQAKHELFDTVVAIGNALFVNMCPQYPKMAELVNGILEDWCEEHRGVVDTRIEEAFKQEEDPFVSTDDLANEIVKVRSERFDRALSHVLKMVEIGAEKGAMAKIKKMAGGAAATVGGGGAGNGPAGANGAGSGMVGGGGAADGGGGGGVEGGGGLGSSALLAPLEEAITDKLGQWYMANHGVSAAALIEDMRTVLTAYWRLSSKRLTENVCMSFEAHVLQKLSEEIESELLTAAQLRPDVDELFFEPPQVVEARGNLQLKKQRFDGAMDTINQLAPDVVATSRRNAAANQLALEGTLDPGSLALSSEAASAHAVAVRRARRLGLPPPPDPKAAAAAGVGGGTGGGGGGSRQEGCGGASPVGGGGQSGGQSEVESEQPIEVFSFSGKSGDNGGYIYWLGTEGKTKKFENPHSTQRLRITSSGMAVGSEESVVSRKRGEVVVKSGSDVFLCLDLGRSRTMAPSHVTLCHGSASSGYDLLSFTLEGHSKKRNKWIDLCAEASPPLALKSPHGVGTWAVDAKGERFRYLRIKSTGPNQRGDNALPICAFEFYGALFRSS